MLDGRNPIDEAFSSVSSFLGENQVKAEPPSSSSIEPWTHKADKIKAKDTSLVLLEENPESDIDVENVDKEGIAEENVINEEAENSKSMNENGLKVKEEESNLEVKVTVGHQKPAKIKAEKQKEKSPKTLVSKHKPAKQADKTTENTPTASTPTSIKVNSSSSCPQGDIPECERSPPWATVRPSSTSKKHTPNSTPGKISESETSPKWCTVKPSKSAPELSAATDKSGSLCDYTTRRISIRALSRRLSKGKHTI